MDLISNTLTFKLTFMNSSKLLSLGVGCISLAIATTSLSAQQLSESPNLISGEAQHISVNTTEIQGLKGIPEHLTIPIRHHTNNFTLELEYKTTRGENFEVLIEQANGVLVPYTPKPAKTYTGTVKELSGSTVSAMLTEAGLEATILTADNKLMYITPPSETAGKQLRTATDSDEYVLTSKSTEDASFHCGVEHDGEETHEVTASKSAKFSLNMAIKAVDLKRAEIAFDVAYSAYKDRYGSNKDNVMKNIDQVVNNTINNIFVRDALIEHVIGKVIIRTDAKTCPYERAGNRDSSSASLNQIKDLWNKGTYGKSHNLATLVVKNGGGRAWVGKISESLRYSVGGGGKDSWRGVLRHEVSHNWGMSHSDDKKNEIKPNGGKFGLMGSADNNRMNENDFVKVTRERNSSNLKSIGRYTKSNIKPFARQDKASVSAGQSVTIRVLNNDHDANGDNLVISRFDAKSVNGATITKKGNTLVYKATNRTGQDRFYYYAGDGKADNWGVVYVDVKVSSVVKVNLNAKEYNYDFGTPESPVKSGWQAITWDTRGDIRWSRGVMARDRGKTPGVNEINQDLVQSDKPTTLSHKIKNGVWEILMNMGDVDNVHDNMLVKAEGKVLAPNLTSKKKEFRYVAGKATVTDGTLSIEFSDKGGRDPNWVVNRLTLKRIGDLPSAAPIGKFISLRKAGGDRKFVRADKTNNRLIADRTVVREWEKFYVDKHPQGGIVLRAVSNGKYVYVPDRNSNAALEPRGGGRFTWERMEWKSMGQNKVALKSVHSGKWLQAAWNENNGLVRARGAQPRTFETFEWRIEQPAKFGAKEFDSDVIEGNETLRLVTNPVVDGRFLVELNLEANTPVQFRLVDIAGKSIAQFSTLLGSGNQQVDLSTMSGTVSGLYLLEVTMEGKRYTKKVLFQ